MPARNEMEFEIQAQCYHEKFWRANSVVRLPMPAAVHAQQGRDHLPLVNTYLLYALPLKSL